MDELQPDQVLERLEQLIAGTRPADARSELDLFRFFHQNGFQALQSIERDRAAVIIPISGPAPVPGRSCVHDELRVAIGVRYFDTAASRARMYRDARQLREVVRTAHGVIAGVSLSDCSPASYEFGHFPGQNVILMRLDVTIHYRPALS